MDVAASIQRILDAAKAVNGRSVLGLTYLRKAEREAISSGFAEIEGVDVAKYLERAFSPTPVRPVDVTTPTDPTSLVASLSTSDILLGWTASTDAVGVDRYEVWRKTGVGGTYALLTTTSSTSYLNSGLTPNTAYYYKIKAVDAANNTSGFSNEANATTPNTSTADVTAPPVPSVPTLVSKDTTNIRVAITPVSDTVVGGALTSGTKDYLVKVDGTLTGSPVTHPAGIISSIVSQLIGSGFTSGSYAEVGGVHTFTSVGGADWYGTTNQLRVATAPGRGALEIIARVVSITSSNSWAKAGISLFDGLDPQGKYFAAVSVGTNGVNGEFRDSIGAQASQFTRQETVTLPIFLRITRSGNVFSAYYSTINGSWLFLGTQTITMSDIVEVGFGVCGNNSTATVVIDNVVITGESPVYFSTTVTPSSSPTAKLLTVASRDNAGNTSTYSSSLSVTPDSTVAPPTGYTAQHPLKSGYWIGGDQSYRSGSSVDPLVVSRGKRLQYLVFSGSYEGKEQGNNGVRDVDICNAIKSASAINTQLGKYVNMNEHPTSGGWFPTYGAYLDTNSSWLYNTGASGTKTPSAYNSAWGNANPTAYGPTDAEGLKPFEFAARYAYRMYSSGYYGGSIGSAANPYLDAIFLDNAFWRPRVNGSWSRSGGAVAWNATLPNGDSVHLAWRKGVRTFFAWLKANTSLKCTGNIADWGEAIDVMGSNAGLSQLAGYLDGGDAEFALGGISSPEVWGNFSDVLRRFKGMRDNIIDQRYLIVTHGGVKSDGSDGLDRTPGAAARYGQAFVSIFSNGGYENEDNAGDVHDAAHAYEFPEQYGGYLNTYGWLGAEVDAPLNACNIAYSTYGCAIREFQKGWVVINPSGNGTWSPTATSLFGSDTAARDILTGNAVSGSLFFANRGGGFYAKRSVYG